jgi:hypothetical protein
MIILYCTPVYPLPQGRGRGRGWVKGEKNVESEFCFKVLFYLARE